MVSYSFKKRFTLPIRAGLGLIGLTDTETGIEVACEFVIDDDKPGVARPFDPLQDLDPPVRPKRQTIRAHGKRRHARPGETLQLYTAMRTKQCKLIGKARCISAQPIKLTFANWGSVIIADGKRSDDCFYDDRLDDFARLDGFDDWEEMKAFWKAEHGLGEFSGVLIKWEPLT